MSNEESTAEERLGGSVWNEGVSESESESETESG